MRLTETTAELGRSSGRTAIVGKTSGPMRDFYVPAARIDIDVMAGAAKMTRPTQWVTFGMHADILVELHQLPLNAAAFSLTGPAHDA
jgi:hypothetical protein